MLMIMSGLIIFLALFWAPFVIYLLIAWLRNWRLARQQPPAQEVATIEGMVERSTEEADDSTRDNSHVSLTLLEPDLLECPICCEPFKIPIFQCTNGHLACSTCFKKIRNICPSCRLPIGYNRCRAMEKVIETSIVSCPNAKYGCKENVSYDNLSSHEKQCVFAPCSCPVLGCNYIGSHKKLKNHFTAKHKEGLVRFMWDTPLNVRLSDKITTFREEKDGELIVVQGFKGPDNVVLVSVSSIAPLATEIGTFCSLEMRTMRSTLTHRLIIKNIQKVSEKPPSDDFLLIPSYMLRSARTIKICISRAKVRTT